MPSASSLANLSAWQGNVLPWLIPLCVSKAVGNSHVCPDALASRFTFADGPHARGQVYFTEAMFCSAQAVSKILPRE